MIKIKITLDYAKYTDDLSDAPPEAKFKSHFRRVVTDCFAYHDVPVKVGIKSAKVDPENGWGIEVSVEGEPTPSSLYRVALYELITKIAEECRQWVSRS